MAGTTGFSSSLKAVVVVVCRVGSAGLTSLDTAAAAAASLLVGSVLDLPGGFLGSVLVWVWADELELSFAGFRGIGGADDVDGGGRREERESAVAALLALEGVGWFLFDGEFEDWWPCGEVPLGWGTNGGGSLRVAFSAGFDCGFEVSAPALGRDTWIQSGSVVTAENGFGFRLGFGACCSVGGLMVDFAGEPLLKSLAKKR